MAASIIASVVTGGTNSHQTVAEELNNVATDFVTQGVVGSFTSGSPNTGAFAVTQDGTPDMGVTILLGRAYVSGTPTGQDAQVLSARMTSNYTAYTINANASGSTRYDWIYLQLSAANANTPASAADNVITLVTSRSTSNATDNGSPPTYGLLLAVVTVANGASSITNGNITDKRVQSVVTTQSLATTGWQTLSNPLTYSANNGNKEFQVTTPSDITGTLSPGMKLKITRSITPPTQCMAFTAASLQYATKASPAGITFTGAFTVEAWVYLNSYTGVQQTILSRLDHGGTTGGWRFDINSSGQVEILYGTTSSFTQFVSYQAIPLNRWVHVAGVITSVSSKTGQIYINGFAVQTSNPLSASTTLTQASVDLRVGAEAGTPANTYFNGYLSEVRLWQTNQTQANIQANMAINLVGNETNLVALYQGSGNFTDATSNANNLTANAGAISTQANNPYNATEYAEVAAASFSNPNTTLTLRCPDNFNIPNQTLNSPNYSTSSNPYGFPGKVDQILYIPLAADFSSAVNSSDQKVIGLSDVSVTIPPYRKYKVRFVGNLSNSAAAINANLKLWDGTVGSGTLVGQGTFNTQQGVTPNSTIQGNTTAEANLYNGSSASVSKTYNVGIAASGSSQTFVRSSTTTPSFLEVLLV